MSDPEVHPADKPKDVDHVVDSANAGLDAAAAARGDVPGTPANDAATRDAAPADAARNDPAVDPDLAAFEAAERDHPGTFTTAGAGTAAAAAGSTDASRTEVRTDDERRDDDAREAAAREAAARDEAARSEAARDEAETREEAARAADRWRDDDATAVHTTSTVRDADRSPMADSAYATSDRTDTTIVPSEPVTGTSGFSGPQPIFVQAPEPPRDRGNRGTAGAIGLLATLAFALLYLGATLGLGAIAGDVTAENLGEAALAPLTTWGFWTPVVVFFLGFWLLGAIINRGRWGLWVIFGIVVGVIAYGGHILGQLFEAPFWAIRASAAADVVNGELLAPLAIAAFVFARELTIWFGAWVARSGARKTELNIEAQREYERTLEAGPTLAR